MLVKYYLVGGLRASSLRPDLHRLRSSAPSRSRTRPIPRGRFGGSSRTAATTPRRFVLGPQVGASSPGSGSSWPHGMSSSRSIASRSPAWRPWLCAEHHRRRQSAPEQLEHRISDSRRPSRDMYVCSRRRRERFRRALDDLGSGIQGCNDELRQARAETPGADRTQRFHPKEDRGAGRPLPTDHRSCRRNGCC